MLKPCQATNKTVDVFFNHISLIILYSPGNLRLAKLTEDEVSEVVAPHKVGHIQLKEVERGKTSMKLNVKHNISLRIYFITIVPYMLRVSTVLCDLHFLISHTFTWKSNYFTAFDVEVRNMDLTPFSMSA